jgi:hypothetical protein
VRLVWQNASPVAKLAAEGEVPSMKSVSAVFVVVSALLVGALAGGTFVRLAFPTGAPQRALYLELMKLTLTDLIYLDDPKGRLVRKEGGDWPGRAHTMIGLDRLDNLQLCMEDVLKRGVPGDFIECGAWRGGATIFMRAVLKAHGVKDRRVWVADSFEGLPAPRGDVYPADAEVPVESKGAMAVSLEQVQENFRRYGLLDDRVQFLKGWFSETLPGAPIERLAVLRVDGDLYESTMDALKSLYPRLSVGGYVIVDDAGSLPPCRKAVEDYRSAHHITSEVKRIDWTGIYWKKEQGQ